jgi:4-amino-4-deoxy-L-arabinose transferase-like glycosyltransferase
MGPLMLQPNPRKRTPSVQAGTPPLELRHSILLVLVFALGFFARTWEYGRLPPSLNPDEASTGVEALNLLRYGQDRNEIPFPVKFISWGSGQDVLYAYLLIPFVALRGSSPTVVRLPMLIIALATIPLLYLTARRIYGASVGLMAAFMLAISPWHIMLSRWALDSNLLPFVFLTGFACLLMLRQNGWWFVPACMSLALCLYAYGTAYVTVPVFMAGAVVVILRDGTLRRTQLWSGLAAFALLSTPILLLLIVNRLGLGSVRLGPITVPQFPVAVRWESTTLIGAPNVVQALGENIATAIRLLATESDTISYNAVEPFGVFYHLGLALAVGGTALIVARREWNLHSELLLMWLAAAACVGILSAVNINRYNIIFIPLIIVGARALHEFQGIHRSMVPLTVLGLLAAFFAFTITYHGAGYRRIADFKFQNGLIPAFLFAQAHSAGTICVTDKINMPYIYALFTEPMSPSTYQASVTYVDPAEPLRRVASYGRYVFGSARCPDLEDTAFVLTGQETAPRMGNRYAYEFFDNFVVYTPIH